MTRILVISDIHANILALEAVLADAGKVDEVWSLGDVVGYGPNPNECVERVRPLPHVTCTMGNHDFAAVGDVALDTFNSDAKEALLWQREQLTEANKDFLRTSVQELAVRKRISLAHGSPRDPIWEYVMNSLTARINLDFFETLWCFVGHTHFQAIFQYHSETNEVTIEVPTLSERLKLNERAILNPGSVGQPRDRDPRAAYAIYYPEERSWEPRRVEYDIETVQKRIQEAGLPSRHAERLAGGW